MSYIEKLSALKHVALIIHHNDHESVYEPLESWLIDNCEGDHAWASVTDEDRQEILRTGSCWTLQWYPATPVGFHCVAAATLERCVDLATDSGC